MDKLLRFSKQGNTKIGAVYIILCNIAMHRLYEIKLLNDRESRPERDVTN